MRYMPIFIFCVFLATGCAERVRIENVEIDAPVIKEVIGVPSFLKQSEDGQTIFI